MIKDKCNCNMDPCEDPCKIYPFKGIDFTAEEINSLLKSIQNKVDRGEVQDGLSAYKIAVANGYQGTEEQWLASLRGPRGNAMTFQDLTPEQIAELQSPATQAAENLNKESQAVIEGVKKDTQEAVDNANKAAELAETNSKIQWYPTVASNGDLSWSRNPTVTPPKKVNIKGPAGRDGLSGSTDDIIVVKDLNGEGSEGTKSYVLGAEVGPEIKENIEETKRLDKNDIAYRVSQFHQHTGFWEVVPYDSGAQTYLEASTYNKGDKVNVPNVPGKTFQAVKSLQGVMPDVNTISNKFTLEEAIYFVPDAYKTVGMEISFIDSTSNQPVVYRYKGGNFLDIISWLSDVYEKFSELQQYAGTFKILPRPTDLNTVMQRGAYPLYQQTASDGYTNVPNSLTSGKIGLLQVDGNDYVCYQTLVIRDTAICTRTLLNGSWSDWVEYKDKSYIGEFYILPRPTDLNTIVKRGTYPLKNQTSEDGYTNAPSLLNNNAGILIVYENEASERFAKGSVIYQMLIINGSNICTRTCISGSWSEWNTILDEKSTKSYVESYAGTFKILPRPTDLNTVMQRGAYPLYQQTASDGYTNVPNSLTSGKIGLLQVDGNDYVCYQTLVIRDTAICTRTLLNGSWSDWVEYKPYEHVKKEFNYNLVSIFRTIGVVGDSLASGQGRINSMSSFKDFYEFSWPQCIAKELNITVHNFTKSGLTTRSWLTDSMGYPLMSDGDHNCTCYIIALGANDVGLGESYLGSPSDIDLENFENNKDTYYGNYAKIISLVKKQEPRAKIFVVPNPSYGNAALRPTFNQAVKYMSTIFDNVYYLDIDESLYNDKDTFIKRNLVANHYTPAAYQYIASYIMSLMTDVIYNNPSEFYFVNLIGTEYQDPQ